jgi:hypothetical protein
MIDAGAEKGRITKVIYPDSVDPLTATSSEGLIEHRDEATAADPLAYQTPPRATVIASPLTPPAASLHKNAITCATSRGARTRF